MDNRARIDQSVTPGRAEQQSAPLARADAFKGAHDAQSLLRTLEQRLSGKKPETEPEAERERRRSRLGRRVFKAFIGIVAVIVFGWYPLQALWQTSSVEAVVNSRLVTLRTPIDGQVLSATHLSAERVVLEQGTAILRIVNTRGDRVRLDDLRRQRARLENERPALVAKLTSTQAAQADLARQATRFREGRIQQLEARIAENEATIAAAAARKDEATAVVERAAELARSGTVSSAEFARLTRDQAVAHQNEQAA